ncbi:MAG: glutathione S-transferase family protein [Oleiphilaceae bacterium]|nr:glutathione S-transferase family protein [Oleiphilaceae bacterium]
MGLLVKGEWRDQWYDTEGDEGEFVRQDSRFRKWITPDGAESEFQAESQRYHLIVSLACPWAHRTLIFRKLKGLEAHIPVTIVQPEMLENGWEFSEEDRFLGLHYLYQLYQKAQADYSGRVTVPVLWDTHTQTIVNNESAEIIRMFNSAFNALTGDTQDFYPAALRADIDQVNAEVYESINNGVYKAGFATRQNVYEKHAGRLFEALDALDQRLATQRYLCGSYLTEADWRLFTTLVRFDAVYFGHFKTNLRRIADYAHLSGYLRDLYQHPGVAETVDFEHIKTHYYYSHDTINPTRIVPLGPDLNLSAPHGREVLVAQG